MLKIYNTLTRKKEIFRFSKNKTIKMYVCGPTVYDFSHIGHGRTYIAFDVIARYLRYSGYKVFYLQNITDIDDKIINRANEEKIDPKILAKRFEKEYLKDTKTLGIKSVNKYSGATQNIREIISQIQRLIKKNYAYEKNGNVYFDITKFKDYGQLSHQSLNQLKKAVRIEPDASKAHSFDFLLWKAKKSGEPFWPSPWGPGRPGWHIEDTAIAERYLGLQYDIHCGALDLIFPHHESEIAQAEAISGKKPFVRFWLHTGFLLVNGEKMSKSSGNFITIREILKNYSPQAFRFLILSHHYRSPIDYQESLMKQAESSLERVSEFLEKIKKTKNKKQKTRARIEALLIKTRKKFFQAMDDDFNAPRAIAEIFNLIKTINPMAGNLEKKEAKIILDFFKETDSVLGVMPLRKTGQIPDMVLKLAKEREKLRKEGKFEKADKIRQKIFEQGYEIEDTPKGPQIKFKKIYGRTRSPTRH
ncbi:MAG: cysteine--tRNA ligase [Parcubacteria group bacterium]|nr:cysteine--tRNA ligase [Parcubacteria group bacterium]